MKKIIVGICGIVIAGMFVLGKDTEVRAALPCTYDIINDANSNIASASACYEKAKAAEAAADSFRLSAAPEGTLTSNELMYA